MVEVVLVVELAGSCGKLVDFERGGLVWRGEAGGPCRTEHKAGLQGCPALPLPFLRVFLQAL